MYLAFIFVSEVHTYHYLTDQQKWLPAANQILVDNNLNCENTTVYLKQYSEK